MSRAVARADERASAGDWEVVDPSAPESSMTTPDVAVEAGFTGLALKIFKRRKAAFELLHRFVKDEKPVPDSFRALVLELLNEELAATMPKRTYEREMGKARRLWRETEFPE